MNFYCSLEKVIFFSLNCSRSHISGLPGPTGSSPLGFYPPCCPHWADLSLFSSPVSFPLKTLCLSLQCPSVFWSNLPHSLPSNSSCAPTNFSLSNSCSFLNPLNLHGAARMCGVWDWNMASSQLPIAPLPTSTLEFGLAWSCVCLVHSVTGTVSEYTCVRSPLWLENPFHSSLHCPGSYNLSTLSVSYTKNDH